MICGGLFRLNARTRIQTWERKQKPTTSRTNTCDLDISRREIRIDCFSYGQSLFSAIVSLLESLIPNSCHFDNVVYSAFSTFLLLNLVWILKCIIYQLIVMFQLCKFSLCNKWQIVTRSRRFQKEKENIVCNRTYSESIRIIECVTVTNKKRLNILYSTHFIHNIYLYAPCN